MEGYLLDTNVISELIRPAPEPSVLAWLTDIAAGGLYLCAPVYGEVRAGILRLADGKRKSKLARDFDLLVQSLFGDGVLAYDQAAAGIWAQLMADGASIGRVRPELDMQIAAIAVRDKLTVVTRDSFHYAGAGVSFFRPWPADMND